MGLLADAYRRARQVDVGLSDTSRALAMLERSGERLWQAELLRLRGELFLIASDAHAVQAESCFRQALDVAALQGAKALGLRAAISLARVLQQQGRGRRTAGRVLLASLYRQFTEGF